MYLTLQGTDNVEKYKEFFDNITSKRNEEKSIPMAKYMQNKFEFLGIQSKDRRDLSKDFLKELKSKKEIDWRFVELCWENEYREFQYIANDYLKMMEKFYKFDDIYRIKELILKKSWWDTIDFLDTIVGEMASMYPEHNELILKWSLDENIWLRRISIDHQLLRKGKTDTELLEKIIINNLGQSEFFINKAIGWALRQYSKTNEKWVLDFIEKYKDNMNPLSIREGSKYIK
ncbi:DNA-7-methylguanine glycosylase [Anaerosphaera aminiphila DSM 21120]|uniref:DNA-7-methylguanine glycosylase n=1 Tax=Anaerosphaera aminiphila DSM 21120 TaxID=1120995 RepID=A0A1M5RNL0_9FIRM|nr:DNA-7-methylguanine glycosylase [Anaerosphaera aminiphila DSM 21120]